MKTEKPTTDLAIVPELGVKEPWQSLFLLPCGYTDLSHITVYFADIGLRDQTALLRAIVVAKQGYTRERKETGSPYPAILELRLSDGCDELVCDTFKPGEWKNVYVGDTVTIHVTVKRNSFRGMYLVSPERVKPQPQPRVEYRGVAGKVSGELVGLAAQLAVAEPEQIAKAVAWFAQERPVLTRLVSKHWGSVESLLKALHAPDSMALARKAFNIAERLCVAEVRLKARVGRSDLLVIEARPELRSFVWKSVQAQPETFSKGQIDALKVIVPALSGRKPERILLNGDVGSGKTLVFLSVVAGLAMMDEASAVMAPNENVAWQIYQQVIRRFPDLSVRYMAGRSTLGPEDARIWIGTTSLLFANGLPDFKLVVVDEQHKFSKAQREQLVGPGTHLLEVSATPIPRSLTIALFDGCHLAQIGTPPIARQIRSHVLGEEDRPFIRDLHHKAIEGGKRVIYLYAAVSKTKPAIAEPAAPTADSKEEGSANKTERATLRTVTAAYDDMNARFPGRVSIVHGQMSGATTELDAFRTGEKPILIASTSIEVGVDVPDVALLVVNDPDRFGIAQLHQIRGRLARNGGQADFIMFVNKKPTKDSQARLSAIQRLQDGFALAEEDLRIRGFGDVAGDLQIGVTETTFKLAQLKPEDFVRRPKG